MTSATARSTVRTALPIALRIGMHTAQNTASLRALISPTHMGKGSMLRAALRLGVVLLDEIRVAHALLDTIDLLLVVLEVLV